MQVFGLEFGGERFGNMGRGGNGGNRSGLSFTALPGLGGFGWVRSRIGRNAFLNLNCRNRRQGVEDINRKHGRIRQKVKNWEQKLASSERMIHVDRHAFGPE